MKKRVDYSSNTLIKLKQLETFLRIETFDSVKSVNILLELPPCAEHTYYYRGTRKPSLRSSI